MPVEPRLVTKAEMKGLMVCEVCGVSAPKKPWPEGWIGCGRSRWMVKRDTVDPTVLAHYCPVHGDGVKSVNPTDQELRTLRERLLQAERDAEQSEPEVVEAEDDPTIRWSARREGLVPMRMSQ